MSRKLFSSEGRLSVHHTGRRIVSVHHTGAPGSGAVSPRRPWGYQPSHSICRRFAPALLAACLLFAAPPARAHRIDEYLQATLLSLGPHGVTASMRLIPGILVAPSVIAAIDTNGDGLFSPAEQQAYAQRVLADLSVTVDGIPIQPHLASWSFPSPAQMREGLGEIALRYTLDLPRGSSPTRTLILNNRHLAPTSVYLVNAVAPDDPGTRILAQQRNPQQSLYQLSFQQAQSSAAPRWAWTSLQTALQGFTFAPLFHLGMSHIAEGTDHLLFLLVLLLPAPLLLSRSRWGPPAGLRRSLLHVVGIVTAFTLGHSITLSLAALGFVHVPSRPVEVLIALSILVSAVHALRPLFPGREAWIAASFGLVHGLAFASTLDRLAVDRWQRLAGILAFNLGIETMQMIVVALILPSLLLLSRTRAYPAFRIAGATFAAACSLAWVAERLFHLQTPVDAIVNTAAHHAPAEAVALLILGLACTRLPSSRLQRSVQTD